MKRFLAGVGLGIAGIALALGLTLGALAIAGPRVGEPPRPPVIEIVVPDAPRTPSEDRPRDDAPSPTAGPSIADDDGSGPEDDDAAEELQERREEEREDEREDREDEREDREDEREDREPDDD